MNFAQPAIGILKAELKFTFYGAFTQSDLPPGAERPYIQ